MPPSFTTWRPCRTRFRIGDAYHIEPSLNRVTGPNGVTRLEPKVMLVLGCLADHAGEMVSKDRLLHAAWADTAVGDDVLTRAISELRRLFDDDPKQPRIIETIPKAGYRLIAPVTRPQSHEPPPDADDPRVVVPQYGGDCNASIRCCCIAVPSGCGRRRR